MRTHFLNPATPVGRRLYSHLSQTSPWVCRACKIQAKGTRHLSTVRKPFYITTPIFYVNAAPHVGHLYTMVLADIIKRWKVLKGEEALLCTGTDEHGLKVQRASAKAGVEPQFFCESGATIFKQLAQKALIANDHFVRTTDREHKDTVEYAWLLLKEKGYIYTEKHEGWYSVADEAFYPLSGVRPYLDPPTGRKMMTAIETGSEVEWSSETNYHFRLSSFRDRLLKFYNENPEWITPPHRMQEVVQAVKAGLEDLSISRPSTRLTWGIRVPGDSSQTIYVWLDALMNYATKAGYPWTPGHDHEGGWPADCHVIGKDIVRFHCIYWPAFLMALGLPLPKRILTHAHWTLGGSKMSKSTGIVVDPFLALDRFGPDVMRFYLAHEGGIQDDTNYNNIAIMGLYKKFLGGTFGNLAARVTRGGRWSVRGAVERVGPWLFKEWEMGGAREVEEETEVPRVGEFEAPGQRFYEHTLLKFPSKISKALDDFDPRRALLEFDEFARRSNQFFHMSSPWSKILPYDEREPGEEVDRIIYQTSEALRMMGILLLPIMPTKAGLLLDQLGVDESRRTFRYCKPGSDLEYGTPSVPLGKAYEGALFPPLASKE